MSQSSAIEFVFGSHGSLLSTITFGMVEDFFREAIYLFLAIIAEYSACSLAIGGWYLEIITGDYSRMIFRTVNPSFPHLLSTTTSVGSISRET